jgi:hypothetical protein
MDKRKLPKGFIEVEEAVELIKSNTFDKPTVDIKKLANSLDWIEVNHNFAIKKMRLITKEEYAEKLKQFPGRRPSELISLGVVTTTLRSAYEVELLKKAIKDNYREVSGRMFDPKNTRGVTTVLDQESGGGARPRSSKKTIAKEGDLIGAGSTSTTNSADSAGV